MVADRAGRRSTWRPRAPARRSGPDHPLTAAHVAAGRPTVSPDLDPLLEFLLHSGLELTGGGRLEVDLVDGEWVLSGPTGWMPGRAGQLLVARLADGRLHLDAVDPATVDEDADLVLQLADRHAWMEEHDRGVEVPGLVLELRARHPQALSMPRPPLSVLLDEAGLAMYGDWVLLTDDLDEDGVPFDAGDDDPTTSLDALARHLVEDHDMAEGQADEFVLLTVLTTGVRLSPPADLDDRERQWIDSARALAGDDPDDPALDEEAMDLDRGLPRLEAILADDAVAQVVPGDLLAEHLAAAGPFAVLAGRVARRGRNRDATSNAWWLYAHALEFLDADGVETERALRTALQAAGDHVGAATDLAWHLDDRGKAGAAVGVLAEHGLGDSGWAHGLRRWAAPGPASAGRNDPCPCGSGRKHKVCCARHNGWPLIDRTDWVFEKLTRFAARLPNAPFLDHVSLRAGVEPMRQGLSDDVAVASMCLFEGGLIADAVRLRGPLLPPDELELLRDWADVRAGAYEVVGVDPGLGLELLDLTTGARHEVVERTASRQLQPGQVVLSWLVSYPDGSTRVALGAVPVPVDKRSSVLTVLDREPDAIDLAAWYASLHAPPRLANTDGDPMTICHAVLTVPDGEAARTALAAVGNDAATLSGRDGAVLEPEGEVFHLLVPSDTGRTVVGTLRLDGDRLTLEANSVARIDALHALAAATVSGTAVVEDTRTPVEELIDGTAARDGITLEPGTERPSGALDLDAVDDLAPEERARLTEALDAWMADAEDRWCDEPVPALGGLTPREAAGDPSRRGDLEALLDEFPGPDQLPGQARGMDPDRLRALLDLPR